MEDTGYRHLVIDTNVLLAWLTPKAHENAQVVERSTAILRAVSNRWWPDVRLLTSSVCIAEAQGVLDKFRLCTWSRRNAVVKPRLSDTEYRHCSNRLAEIYKRQEFTCVETAPDIVSASGVVSLVNQKYQFRRRTKKSKARIRQPMGGADCLVVATAIIMEQRIHPSVVYLVTADQRMADVCRKARQISASQADSLGLIRRCRSAGLTWNKDLFPRPLLLQDATADDLRECLTAWPLPDRSSKDVSDTERMSRGAQDCLVGLYAEVKSRTRIGVEKLPYSIEINQMRSDLACQYGCLLTNRQIFETLQRWRKKGELDLSGRIRRRKPPG